MAVKSTGSLSLKAEISVEFNGPVTNVSMSAFKRAGAYVPSGPSANANIPTTNSNIKISQFYSSVRGFSWNPTISSSIQNYNLRSAALTAGWDGVIPLLSTITVATAIYVGSSSTSLTSWTMGGAFPAGSVIALINNGYILGAGGNAAVFNSYYNPSSYPGGNALNVDSSISITNNGIIGGGGGGGYTGANCGGAGGGGGGGGGAGWSPGYSNGYGGGSSAGGPGGTGGSFTGGAGGAGGCGQAGGAGGDLGQYGPSANGAPGYAVTGNSYVTWTLLGDVRGTRTG